MTIDLSKLKDMPVEDLRQLAIQQGLTPHHRAKPETLVQQIIDHVTQPPVQPEAMKHPAEKPQVQPNLNTEEQVREACKEYLGKEGYQAFFYPNDTWHFKYRGAEDSGHMSVPMRVIKMKAQTVSYGARKMVTVKNEAGQDVMLAGR